MLKHYSAKKNVHIYAYTIAYYTLTYCIIILEVFCFAFLQVPIVCQEPKKNRPLQSPATEKKRVRQPYHDLRLDEIDVDDLEDAGFTTGGCETPRFMWS